MLIERKAEMKILRNLKDEKIIKVITGVRRCGKSTLLQMFADELLANNVSKKQIHIINFDNPDTLAIGDYLAVYRSIEAKLDTDRMNYVFLDEVQNLDSFEKMLEGLNLLKSVDLYITGSNAKMLSGDLATLLTGRYITIEMLPYSYSEYSNALSNYGNLSDLTSFRNFLYNGALPQVVSLGINHPSERDSFVSDILSSIIEKDIFLRHEIYNKSEFLKVLDFVFDSVGSEVSPNSISNTLLSDGSKVADKTVSNYLDYLTEAMLLYKVPRYDIKGKKLLKTLDKYYLVDTGFRKSRLKKSANDDIGHLLENVVYLELRRRNKNVWVGNIRQGQVDFVVEDKQGYTSYYQVAYTTTDNATLERELKPLLAIHNSDKKVLLTADFDIDPVYDGIRKYNVERWLKGEYDD